MSRTAEEWGRIAVSLPGWRWMPRMLDTTGRTFIEYADCGEAQWLWAADDGCEHLPVACRAPDPDDPATAGCLLALLNWPNMLHNSHAVFAVLVASPFHPNADSDGYVRGRGPTLGRACIAAAETLGRWPGGEA